MAKQDISNEQENNGRKVNKKWWHIPFLLLLCAGTIYVIRTNNTSENSTSGMHESAAIGEAWNDADIQKCSGSVFGTEYHITAGEVTKIILQFENIIVCAAGSVKAHLYSVAVRAGSAAICSAH